MTWHKEVADELFPSGDFLGQFFKGDDIRLECVYPIKYKKEVPFLRLKVDRGADNWMVFEPATILKGMSLTPQVGQFVEVVCKVRLYPTHKEAGHLDRSVKEHVVIEMAPLNVDIEDIQAA